MIIPILKQIRATLFSFSIFGAKKTHFFPKSKKPAKKIEIQKKGLVVEIEQLSSVQKRNFTFLGLLVTDLWGGVRL